MVLAVFAMGYNLLFGYVGLLSLGHAMFFSAGLYGAGLTIQHLGWGVPAAFVAGHRGGRAACARHRPAGAAHHRRRLHDRHHDVRAGVLSDDPLFWRLDARRRRFRRCRSRPRTHVRRDVARSHDPPTRYMVALALFSRRAASSRSPSSAPRYGRVLVAIRENEERTRCSATTRSPTSSSPSSSPARSARRAGAAYALLFGYVGSTFASVQYSILPLLWVLLGGAATTLGPLIGTLFMYLCRRHRQRLHLGLPAHRRRAL